jgi:hypothetical protein
MTCGGIVGERANGRDGHGAKPPWRNVRFYVNGSARVTFEAIFDENGTITFGYADIDSTPLEQGGQATVGVENVDGTVALAYSYNQPVLRSGVEVRFLPLGAPPRPPPRHRPHNPRPQGAVTGTVTNGSIGFPAAGVTVTLTPGSASMTTAVDGTYRFDTPAAGTCTVTGGNNGCSQQSASASRTVSTGTSIVNLTPTGGAPVSGYTCTAGPTTWIAADQTDL